MNAATSLDHYAFPQFQLEYEGLESFLALRTLIWVRSASNLVALSFFTESRYLYEMAGFNDSQPNSLHMRYSKLK